MFDKVEVRYALRCVLFGVSGFFVAVQAHGTPVTGTSIWESAVAGAIAALAYAGIGAAVPQVEPSIGKTLDIT
jgi:hypothetical protein